MLQCISQLQGCTNTVQIASTRCTCTHSVPMMCWGTLQGLNRTADLLQHSINIAWEKMVSMETGKWKTEIAVVATRLLAASANCIPRVMLQCAEGGDCSRVDKPPGSTSEYAFLERPAERQLSLHALQSEALKLSLHQSL